MSVHVCKCEHNGRTEYHLRYPGMTEKEAQDWADKINGGAPYIQPQAQAQELPDERADVSLESVYETIIHWDEGGGKRSRRELARRIVALFAQTQLRKPMTDEQIINTWHDVAIKMDGMGWHNNAKAFARAIEAHHGIVEKGVEG